jgi:DNA-binding GntR family transcriptional regulator
VRKKWIEFEAHRFEREIDMTETATRNRSRPRFKPTRLKLSAIRPKQALQRHSLHDQLVAKLREMILNGELRPGSALPEKMLCESFGVSRTPLREAFKVLASEGLIELRPHRTPQITLIDPDEIKAVFEVMVALERLVGVRTASLATPTEIAAIEAMHEQLVALHHDGSRAAYFHMNQQIHAEIARLNGNPVLQTTWAALTAKILRARSLANFDARRWDESINEHEHFMALLRAGEAEGFADALSEHMRRTGAAVCVMLATTRQAPEGTDQV